MTRWRSSLALLEVCPPSGGRVKIRVPIPVPSLSKSKKGKSGKSGKKLQAASFPPEVRRSRSKKNKAPNQSPSQSSPARCLRRFKSRSNQASVVRKTEPQPLLRGRLGYHSVHPQHSLLRVSLLVRFEPGATGAGFDFDGDLVRESEGVLHHGDDLRSQGRSFTLGKVEEEFVVDLEEHFALGLLIL